MDSSRKNKTKALRKNTERAGLGAKSLQATTRKELAAQKYRQSIRDLIAGAGPVIARIAIQPETDRLVEVLCVTRFFVVMPPFPRLFGAQHETDGGGGAIN